MNKTYTQYVLLKYKLQLGWCNAGETWVITQQPGISKSGLIANFTNWIPLQIQLNTKSRRHTLPLTSVSCTAWLLGCWRGSAWCAGSFGSAWALEWGWFPLEGTPLGSALRSVAAGCSRKTGWTRGVSRSTKKETANVVLNGTSTLFHK